MHVATISSKLQVTIPRRMLTQLGLIEKNQLMLAVKGNQLIARPVQRSIIDMISGSVNVAPSKRGTSVEEIMAVTRKKVARQLARNVRIT